MSACSSCKPCRPSGVSTGGVCWPPLTCPRSLASATLVVSAFSRCWGCVPILCGLRLNGTLSARAGSKRKSRFAQRGRPSFHIPKALRVPKVRTPKAGPAASQPRGPTFSGCHPARVGGTENLSSRQAPRDTGRAGLWTTATGTLAPPCVRKAAFGTGGVLSPRPAAGKQFAEPLSRHVSWYLPCGGKILSLWVSGQFGGSGGADVTLNLGGSCSCANGDEKGTWPCLSILCGSHAGQGRP